MGPVLPNRRCIGAGNAEKGSGLIQLTNIPYRRLNPDYIGLTYEWRDDTLDLVSNNDSIESNSQLRHLKSEVDSD